VLTSLPILAKVLVVLSALRTSRVVTPFTLRVPPTFALVVTFAEASVELPETFRFPPTIALFVTVAEASVEAPVTPRVPPTVALVTIFVD